jgi:hypothetical protein
MVRSLAFSADGRLLASGHSMYPGFVCVLWDAERGGEALRVPHGSREQAAVAFSADGKTLAVTSAQSQVLLCDLSGWLARRRTEEAAPADLGKLWDRLGGDAKDAYQASRLLAAGGDKAVALVKQHVRPADMPPEKPDEKVFQKLIADLDSDDFATREKAQKSLAEAGKDAHSTLRRAMEGGKLSQEQKARVRELLQDEGSTPGLPEATLKAVRGVGVLERVGSPAAREVLESLARGAPEALETKEAEAALKRLGRKQ